MKYIKRLIVILVIVLFQLSFIYSEEEIIVNEDLLAQNPTTFWEMVLDFPQALLDLTINGLRDALVNSRDNFLSAINNDRSVLSNEDVRAVYLEALSENPQELVASHPELFEQMLQEEGVDNSGSFNFEVLSYDFENNVLLIGRDEDQTISISLSDLNGGTLNSDGSIVLNNGVLVNSGSITQESGEYRVINGIVEIYEREVRGDDFILGPTHLVDNPYVRANSEILFDDGLERRNILERGGQVSFYESGAIGLNGALRISTVNENGVLIPERRIVTDLNSVDDEMIIVQNPSQCIDSSFGGCIIDQGDRMEIRARNQGNLEVDIYSLEHVAVRVPLIEDSTQLQLTRFLEEDSRVIYTISRDETTLSGGFPSQSSLLTLNTFHPQLGHPGIDGGNIIGHIFNAEHPLGIELEAHQLIEGLDLSRFSESLQEQLNNANFDSISGGEVSIVAALNSLGLPSDMSFRSELAELLGIEGYRGTASQNTQLLNMLRNEGIQGSQRITIGEQFRDIFELDPNLGEISPQLTISSLENANFQGVNFNDPSIVRIMNQMGLDSSFAARQELYRELFGREPPRGGELGRGSDMNIALREILGEIHINIFRSSGTIDVPTRGHSIISLDSFPLDDDGSMIIDLESLPLDETETEIGFSLADVVNLGVIEENDMDDERGTRVRIPADQIETLAEIVERVNLDLAQVEETTTPELPPLNQDVRTTIPPQTLRQPTRSGTLRPPRVSDPSYDRLIYANQGATRNRGLASDLERILQATAEETNTRIRITSGGQCGINSGCTRRTGSTRHDYGNAADFDIIDATTGRVISYGEPAFFQFLTTLSANGARGVGADRDGRYMNQGAATGRVHADIESPAVWGHNGRGVNAPDPVRRAVAEGERIRVQRCREAGVVCR